MKRKQLIASVITLTVAASMLAIPVTNVEAVSSKPAHSKLFNLKSIKTVNLTSKSTLEVNDAQFYYVKDEKYVYYTVTVHNKDNKALNLLDYWFNVKSNTGEKYSIQLMGINDKKDNLIPSQTSKSFKIYTKVNAKLNLYNLTLNVIKWDFSVSGFERTIGSIPISSSYSNITPVGKDRKINDGKLVTTASALQLVEVGNQTEAMISMFLENVSDGTLSLNNYKYYLKTATNRYYLMEPEIQEISLLSGEKKKINFYTKLPDNMQKENYQLFIAEEVGGETKTEIPVAYYSLMKRSQANAIVNANKNFALTINGQSVQSQLTNTMIDSNSEYNNITMTYELTNVSKKPVKLPKYNFFLSTSSKEIYPLTSSELEEELLPGIKREITLTASIPSNMSVDNLKMLVKQAPDEKKTNDYLIAQYRIPAAPPVTTNDKTTYVNKQGSYEVTISNFERLPWDVQDIVNTTITIKNIGDSAQPMPQIKATTWLDGLKIDSKNTQIVQVQEALGLQPGESSTLILTTKVSSDAKFEKARVQLSEVIDDKPVNTVGNFMLTSKDASIPIYQPGSTSYYTLKQPGVEANLTVLDTNTYTGTNTNVVDTLLAYRNIGARYSKLPALQAYYYTENGEHIPAKVTVVESEVGPESVNLISIKGDIPKRYTSKDVKLLIGQGIASGKFIQGNEKPDSYINAALLGLANEETEVGSLFKSLELRPYTFRINRINAASATPGSVQFNFEYTMTEYNPYHFVLNKRNLVFELVYNGKKFSKTYPLGDGNGALAVGEKIRESFLIEDLAMHGVSNGGFDLNIYDEVDGAKKLLITHKVYSFGNVE